MTEYLTSTSWVIFFKVLSVNKLCLVQFVLKIFDQKKDLKNICPVNKEIISSTDDWRSDKISY